jgi:hypothetical protein
MSSPDPDRAPGVMRIRARERSQERERENERESTVTQPQVKYRKPDERGHGGDPEVALCAPLVGEQLPVLAMVMDPPRAASLVGSPESLFVRVVLQREQINIGPGNLLSAF